MPVQVRLQSPHTNITCTRIPNTSSYTLLIDDEANQIVVDAVPERQLKAIALAMFSALPVTSELRTSALVWLNGIQ